MSQRLRSSLSWRLYFVAEPTTPTQIQCASACTVTVVHELSLPPLQIDAAEGAQIAGAILAVWATGFGIRMLIQTLKTSDGNSTESET
jgi:hypothetical protein